MSELRERIAEALLRLAAEDQFQILEELPCCEDCGLEEMADEGVGSTDAYCFYHQQDLTIHDEGAMYLSWGSSPEDARLVVRRMEDAGLVASWDGDPEHRVHVRLP